MNTGVAFIYGMLFGFMIAVVLSAFTYHDWRAEAITKGYAVNVLEKPTDSYAKFTWKCDIKEEKK